VRFNSFGFDNKVGLKQLNMKQTLFFLTIVFFSINALAQDQKWSLEASYPISIGNRIGNDNPGIGDLGIKYRFLNFDFVQIGVGLNVSLFKDRIQGFTIPETMDFKETNWIFQPKIFAEFHIPSMPRLKYLYWSNTMSSFQKRETWILQEVPIIMGF